MINTTSIYFLHEGNDIPIYVGKTKNDLVIRERSHRNKFQNPKLRLECIDEVPTSEWQFWEKYYISLFKSWGFILKNKNEGGGGNTYMTESTKIKIKEKLLNRNYLPEWKEALSKATKGKSKMQTPERGKNISLSKKGKPNYKLSKSTKGKSKPKNGWKINQYDLLGNFLKEWPSAKQAALFYNTNQMNIHAAARGDQKTSCNYIWKYN